MTKNLKKNCNLFLAYTKFSIKFLASQLSLEARTRPTLATGATTGCLAPGESRELSFSHASSGCKNICNIVPEQEDKASGKAWMG